MFTCGFLPDIFSSNTLIAAFCKEGWTTEACYIYNIMSKMGVCPDQISYKMIKQGLCFHDYATKANLFLHAMLDNSFCLNLSFGMS